mgnify:CR=1 FL=1
MDTRIKLKHEGVTKELVLHSGIEVADFHALVKAAFPTAGIVAGFEDEKKTLWPLVSICSNPANFKDGVFTIAVALPHVEVRL